MAIYHTAGEELLFIVAKDHQHVRYRNTANINTNCHKHICNCHMKYYKHDSQHSEITAGNLTSVSISLYYKQKCTMK